MIKNESCGGYRIAIVITVLIILALAQTAQAGEWPMYKHDPAHTGVSDEAVEPPLYLLWEQTIGNFSGSPVISGGLVYIPSDKKIYVLDAVTGAPVWNYTTEDFAGSVPAVLGGVVYIGSADGYVYALDAATGALLWNYTTGSFFSSPAIAGGIVYIGSDDGKIYAFKTQPTFSISGFKINGATGRGITDWKSHLRMPQQIHRYSILQLMRQVSTNS